jgi:WXXGXW repeat (2 copies)
MLLKTWSRLILPTLFLLALPALSMGQVSVNVSVGVPPPELPVYEQPAIPGDGYIWTPGYWAWSDDDQDYYWVPGTWVLAPQPGYLWTPGYWGWGGAAFIWHLGYWGPHVGFYGGVNYGYGYGGNGYEGGYWQGDRLYYNRTVNNISTTNITNVYNKTVINNVTVNRVSYNGGNGGVRAQPTPAEEAATRERHIAVTPAQRQHDQTARSTPELRASRNQGHPPIAATPRPATFSGPGVVPAKGGTMSVVHSPQPQPRVENQPRGAQSETRTPQPAPQRPQEYRPPVQQQRPPVQQQSRPPVEQQRPPVQQQRPQVEQRRPPEQAQPPKQSAPPREAPRPSEHPPEH